VNIPFSSDPREMFSEQIHTAAEQFPTVNGKRDVHYNDRREKFTLLKIQRHDGTVNSGKHLVYERGMSGDHRKDKDNFEKFQFHPQN
jgi:hypothetical protein